MTTMTNNEESKTFIGTLTEHINGWVAVAIVLPTLVTWKGMPVYESQRATLTTVTALSCALILAFLFASRDFIPKVKSRIGHAASLLIPLALIIGTFYSIVQYLHYLKLSANICQESLSLCMQHMQMNDINHGEDLIWYYIQALVLAECAFFFMAFKEWRPR